MHFQQQALKDSYAEKAKIS
jgi:hypothetical protein